MNDYVTQETPRGGTFHLHHKRKTPLRPAQKDMAFPAEPLALVAETAPDPERIQAEHQARLEAEKQRQDFEKNHQLRFA